MSCASEPGPSSQNEEQKLMARRREVRRTDKSQCQRCREAKSKHVVRQATYCRACFESNVNMRFTRQLFPPLRSDKTLSTKSSERALHRPRLQHGNVLVALSGGAGSMAMLDLLLKGGCIGKGDGKRADLTKNEKEVFWDKGTVVFVEFAGVIDGLDERTEWIKTIAEDRGLDFVGLRAEDVFDPELGTRLGRTDSIAIDEQHQVNLRAEGLPITAASGSRKPLESLQTLLSTVPIASRPALLSYILNNLLNTAAKSIPNISHLLVGDTSTRQAQRVISGTALGRGWSLPLELSVSQDLKRGITRIQPMRDVSVNEAAVYCHGRSLESKNHRLWSKVKDGSTARREGRGKYQQNSIEGLTEDFIAGLMVTHPSTVSTINRTGDKLVFPGEDRSVSCPVCEMPVDASPLAWKSRTALTKLATKVSDSNGMPNGSSAGVSDAAGPTEHEGHSGLAPLLCYACLTTFTVAISNKKDSLPGTVELPHWIGQGAVSRESMKYQISDYLLADA